MPGDARLDVLSSLVSPRVGRARGRHQPGVDRSRGGGRARDSRLAIRSVGREAESLREAAGPGDRTWVLVLGHANLDDGHAFLHLPGPDLRDDEFAALFRGLRGRERVFWMTHAASGAFLAPLSATGRIVIAATDRDGEANETEFPHALAEVSRRPAARVDFDKDGRVSVLEVFSATSEAVEARFSSDKRAPTEHARLDDNGDGVGTERTPTSKPANPEGSLASMTFLPMVAPATGTKPKARSDHGTGRVAPPSR